MIQLHNIDCMEYMRTLPDKAFELAIVDPPYGIGLGFSMPKKVKNGTMTAGHKPKEWNDGVPGKDYFDEIHRVSANQIIWGAQYYWEFIKARGVIVHDKMVTPFIASTYSQADIASCSMQKRVTVFRHQWSGNVQNGTMNTKNIESIPDGMEHRIHPTQKPVALYKWLLKNYAKPNDRILDTHLGSGSIAIACHDMGFDLVGCELDKDYYEAACKRLKNHQAQGAIF